MKGPCNALTRGSSSISILDSKNMPQFDIQNEIEVSLKSYIKIHATYTFTIAFIILFFTFCTRDSVARLFTIEKTLNVKSCLYSHYKKYTNFKIRIENFE